MNFLITRMANVYGLQNNYYFFLQFYNFFFSNFSFFFILIKNKLYNNYLFFFFLLIFFFFKFFIEELKKNFNKVFKLFFAKNNLKENDLDESWDEEYLGSFLGPKKKGYIDDYSLEEEEEEEEESSSSDDDFPLDGEFDYSDPLLKEKNTNVASDFLYFLKSLFTFNFKQSNYFI